MSVLVPAGDPATALRIARDDTAGHVTEISGWVVRAAFARVSGGSASQADMAAIAVRSLLWAFFVGALGFGISALGARPEPIIATARISTTAPGASSALVPTALHAG